MRPLHEARSRASSSDSADDAEGSLARLIQHLRGNRRCGPMLKLSQRSKECTPVNINLAYIRSALAASLRDAFVSMAELGRKYSRSEIQTLSRSMDDVMPDIIGRALYKRLLAVARASFPTRATFGSMNPLPAPIARAINGIGPFSPVDVPEDVLYVPTLEKDPGLSGGTNADGNCIQYMLLLEEFKHLGWPLATINKDPLAGTSWYLLPVECYHEGTDSFDVIARFPTAAGNITDTDCIIRTFCLHPVDGSTPEMLTMESTPSRHYGTVLRFVKFHESATFLEVDLGTPAAMYCYD